MSEPTDVHALIDQFQSAFALRNIESVDIANGYAVELRAALDGGASPAVLTGMVDQFEQEWDARAAESSVLTGVFADSLRSTIAALEPPVPTGPKQTLWMSIDSYDELTDADFVSLRDDWGITTLVAQFGYVRGYGGSQQFTSDTSATFDAADGRAGSQWTQCRKVKYGNNGTGTVGRGNIVNRVHALGMTIHHGLRLRSLPNRTTPLAVWHDDAAWAALVSPTGAFAERFAYAEGWGFDGMAFDGEILNDGQTPQPTWKFNYSGAPAGEVATRAKVYQRGQEFGSMIAAVWPDVEVIEYVTTGHAGFPDDYDEDYVQPGAGRVEVKEPLVERNWWDGIFGSAWTGDLSILNASFYRGPYATAAEANDMMAYNRDHQLARMAAPAVNPLGTEGWVNWQPGRVHVNPFIWPGRATNTGEDQPLSLAKMTVAFDAARAQHQGRIGFYCQSITLDRAYFTPEMLEVLRG